MVNGQHKVNYYQHGIFQCKYSMGTRLSPPIMLLESGQKLALIIIVIIFRLSITGVTNSGATLLGTHLKWQRYVPKRNKLSISLSLFTTGSISALKEPNLSKTTMKNLIMPSNAPIANRMKIFNTCLPVSTGVLLRHDKMQVRLSGRQSEAMRQDHTL